MAAHAPGRSRKSQRLIPHSACEFRRRRVPASCGPSPALIGRARFGLALRVVLLELLRSTRRALFGSGLKDHSIKPVSVRADELGVSYVDAFFTQLRFLAWSAERGRSLYCTESDENPATWATSSSVNLAKCDFPGRIGARSHALGNSSLLTFRRVVRGGKESSGTVKARKHALEATPTMKSVSLLLRLPWPLAPQGRETQLVYRDRAVWV